MYSGFQLKGKNAIITGGTRGIGLAIAKGFVDCGANVTICSRKQDNVNSALAEINSDNVLGVAGHVGKSDDLERIANAAEERFGPTNVLVNNAGTNPYFGPIVDAEVGAWDKTMEVNLKGPFLLSSLCAKRMSHSEGSGGSIINVSSVAGLHASPMQGIYSISKAGLIMLTKVMARELGRQKIRVNCICPGLIKTQLSEAMWSDPKLERTTVEAKALGRIGLPDELVGAAVYLASDSSSFTTGSVIQVDGGMII